MKPFSSQLNKLIDSISSAFEEHPFAQVDKQIERVDRDDARFIQKQLSCLPTKLQNVILNEAEKLAVRKERNTYIREVVEKIGALFPEKLRQRSIDGDDAIMSLAVEFAERCRRTSYRYKFNSEGELCDSQVGIEKHNTKALTLTEPLIRNEPLTECYSSGSCIDRPLNESSRNGEHRVTSQVEMPLHHNLQARDESNRQKKLLGELALFAKKCGLALPTKNVTDKGTIKRLCDEKWWKVKLKKVVDQSYEQSFIELGQVNKHRQIYCSDFSVTLRAQQKLRNFNTLSSIFVINDAGEQFSVQEISDKNVSNPIVRKAELMVRMRGFEELSKELGEVGVFITITCPSKYHAVFAKSGQRNPKYQSKTPYQANQYLCQVWARIRSAWQKQNIAPYGFRVAEPQHDGTPHWHFLLFMKPEDIDPMKSIVSHYALLEDGDEDGARENRCDFKRIDPKKGSATGYIAKYVSKNIDGLGLDKGVYGEDPITTAQRVDAWASCWCIRQFQQIGGAPVSIYRELRRLKTKLGDTEVLEQARQAADESSWSRYIMAMGGLNIKRKDRQISLAYETSADEVTGECKIGYYDNEVLLKLKGLYYKGEMFVTRFFDWKVVKSSDATKSRPKIKRNLELFNLEYCK